MRALVRTMALLALLPGAALAEQMDGAAFERMVTGKTITFSREGQVVGREEYRPGRRVIWQAEGQDCQYGQWFEDSGAICFVYDDGDGPVCWKLEHSDGQIRARSMRFPDEPPLVSTGQSPAPIACPGPAVGV